MDQVSHFFYCHGETTTIAIAAHATAAATAPAAVGIGKLTYLFVYKNITGGFLPTNPVLELFDFDPNRIFIYDERRMPQQ